MSWEFVQRILRKFKTVLEKTLFLCRAWLHVRVAHAERLTIFTIVLDWAPLSETTTCHDLLSFALQWRRFSSKPDCSMSWSDLCNLDLYFLWSYLWSYMVFVSRFTWSLCLTLFHSFRAASSLLPQRLGLQQPMPWSRSLARRCGQCLKWWVQSRKKHEEQCRHTMNAKLRVSLWF